MPPFAGERDQNSAKEIDVIWFGEDENPQLCFEVEHSTGIVSGLHRLTQLKHQSSEDGSFYVFTLCHC